MFLVGDCQVWLRKHYRQNGGSSQGSGLQWQFFPPVLKQIYQAERTNFSSSHWKSEPVNCQRSWPICQYSYWTDLIWALSVAEPTFELDAHGHGPWGTIVMFTSGAPHGPKVSVACPSRTCTVPVTWKDAMLGWLQKHNFEAWKFEAIEWGRPTEVPETRKGQQDLYDTRARYGSRTSPRPRPRLHSNSCPESWSDYFCSCMVGMVRTKMHFETPCALWSWSGPCTRTVRVLGLTHHVECVLYAYLV